MKKRVLSMILCAVLSVSVVFGGFTAKTTRTNHVLMPLCDLPTSPVDQ